MDFNYLLHRRQVSRMRANAGTCVEASRTDETFAARYARQIDTFLQEQLPRKSSLGMLLTLNAA